MYFGRLGTIGHGLNLNVLLKLIIYFTAQHPLNPELIGKHTKKSAPELVFNRHHYKATCRNAIKQPGSLFLAAGIQCYHKIITCI